MSSSTKTVKIQNRVLKTNTSHQRGNQDSGLMDYDTVSLGVYSLAFRMEVMPLFSRVKRFQKKKTAMPMF